MHLVLASPRFGDVNADNAVPLEPEIKVYQRLGLLRKHSQTARSAEQRQHRLQQRLRVELDSDNKG